MVAVLQPVIGAHSWASTKERLQVRPTLAPLHHRHAFFAPVFTNRLPRDHAHPSLDSPKFARHSVPMPCYRSMVGNPVISSFSPRTAGLAGADAAEKEPARRPPALHSSAPWWPAATAASSSPSAPRPQCPAHARHPRILPPAPHPPPGPTQVPLRAQPDRAVLGRGQEVRAAALQLHHRRAA